MTALKSLTCQLYEKSSFQFICSLNESEASFGSVDLPYVELFVLLDALINLIRLESLGQTLLHHLIHLDRLATLLWRHLTNHSIDLICHVLLPESQAVLLVLGFQCAISRQTKMVGFYCPVNHDSYIRSIHNLRA